MNLRGTTMDEEENECRLNEDNDYVIKIKRNEEDYKFLKLEEPENKLNFDMKLFKLESSDQLDSKYRDNITKINEMKIKGNIKHNDSMKNKCLFKLKNEVDINGYVSNELLSICKSEKIIIDIGDDPQPNTSENILDRSESGFDHAQARAWYSFESRQTKKKNISNTKSVDKSKIFNCSQCNYQSQSRKNFVAHLLMHSTTGNRKRRKLEYKCAHCHYISSKRGTLSKHLNTHGVYGEESVYKCSHCATEFKYRCNLIRHLSTEHLFEKPRPFTCSSCPVAYGTSYELNRHSLIHSRELPYECAHCDYATTRRYILQEHLARHKRNTSSSTCVRKHNSRCRVKSCRETCRKEEEHGVRDDDVGLKPQSIQREDKYPFKCATCGYRTSKLSLLKYHIVRRHTKEPVFECLTCDYSTFRREELVKHRQDKKHDTFSCEHCDYTCFKYVLIEKHMKTHFKYC